MKTSFFWSLPNFGQENRMILSGDLFLLVFIILKFSAPPPPPPLSKILRTQGRGIVEQVWDLCATPCRVPTTFISAVEFVQRWSLGLKAKDRPTEDRPSRGQKQECWRPRTQAQVLFKKKEVFKNFFQAISREIRFPKNFSGALQTINNSKNCTVFKPRTGQFSRTWGFEAKDLTFEV